MYQLAYSEHKERAADEAGLQMAMRAAYDPREMVHLMERFRKRFGEQEPSRARSPQHEIGGVLRGAIGEYFQTHPPFRQRIADMERTMRDFAAAQRQDRWYVGRTNYQSTVTRTAMESPGEWVIWSP
jgi:predicted Zn-dependent protease